MKTIMDKLANQLNSKEKAIAAVDVVSPVWFVLSATWTKSYKAYT